MFLLCVWVMCCSVWRFEYKGCWSDKHWWDWLRIVHSSPFPKGQLCTRSSSGAHYQHFRSHSVPHSKSWQYTSIHSSSRTHPKNGPTHICSKYWHGLFGSRGWQADAYFAWRWFWEQHECRTCREQPVQGKTPSHQFHSLRDCCIDKYCLFISPWLFIFTFISQSPFIGSVYHRV